MRNIIRRSTALAVIAAALFAMPHPASAADFTLRVATWGSPQHPQVTAWVPIFTEEVQRASGGRIAVQTFPAASLIKEQDVPSALPAGVADISLTILEDFSGLDPAMGVFGSPLMQFSFPSFFRAMRPGTPLFSATNDELRSHGAILLSAIDVGPPVFASRDLLRVPADFRGKNIRVFSGASGALVQELGGAPTQLSQNDVYAALSTGTVQAAFGGLPGVFGAKQYEVAKYIAEPGGIFGLLINGYVMNANSFNRLPPDLQKIVLAAAYKANVAANAANEAAYDRDIAAMAAHGNVMTKLNPNDFKDIIAHLRTEAIAKYGRTSRLMKALLAALAHQ
jgi:TRAP-type C4-dicarboxylate transport system substrate-binding protein